MTDAKQLALGGSITILKAAQKGSVTKMRAIELAVEILTEPEQNLVMQLLLDLLEKRPKDLL